MSDGERTTSEMGARPRRAVAAAAPPLPEETLAALAALDLAAPDRFLQQLAAGGVHHDQRHHEPALHARHLAAIWGGELHEAGRATLFYADGAPVLAVVPADRKIAAPRLRDVLGVRDLRVLRGDRGVGRLGWRGLPGDAAVLPAVPELYRARCLVDTVVLRQARLIVAVTASRSVALAPGDYLRVTGGEAARFMGMTRLLPQGGMVNDPLEPA